MRTTLDINPRVLAAARARVHRGLNRNVSDAVSEFALAGLASQNTQTPTTSDLILLPAAPGHVVTTEMIAQALLDE